VATLESYRNVEFNQGHELGSAHKFKPDVQGGVCAALCNCWILKMWDGMNPYDMVELNKEFNIAVSKQRIWADAFGQVKGNLETNYNSISHITRIRLSVAATGQFVDPLGTSFGTVGDGDYMLEFRFGEKKGGHMMAFFTNGNAMALFDPNLGVFIASGTPAVKDFAAQLWAKYASWGLVVGTWIVWSITKAESARERMLKKLGQTT